RAQHAFHQLRHREFLRSADLDDAVDRWPECDVGEHGNDVAGQDRLEQRRRDMNALLTGSRDTTDELEELRRAQDRIRNAGLPDQVLLRDLRAQVRAAGKSNGADERQRYVRTYAGALLGGEQVRAGRLKELDRRFG